jgi:hypothetical protein
MSNKQSQQTTSVADAEHAIGNLQAKRDALVARSNELATVRASVAYKALNDGDAAARSALDRVNKETTELGAAVASLDAALVTARQRLVAAQQAAALAAQAAHAQVIIDEWSDAGKDLADLDAGLSFAVGAAANFYQRCERMKQHGATMPAQLSLMLTDVVVSLLMAMPPPLWRQLNDLGLPYLPPNKRRNGASLATAWGPQVQRQAAAISGAQQPNEPEAA